MSTPYDLDAVDHLNSYVSAFKIGSGDVAWNDMLLKVSSQKTQFSLQLEQLLKRK